MINELFKKIEAQDKIINTQALEIARLKEEIKELENARYSLDRIELERRIEEAIEYIGNVLCNSKAQVRNDISGKEIDNLIEILGDKENE